jgi:hypothetical protein
VTIVIGIFLVALGIWLLLGRDLTALTPRSLARRTRSCAVALAPPGCPDIPATTAAS